MAVAKATQPKVLQLVHLLKSNPISTFRLQKSRLKQQVPTSKVSKCTEAAQTNNRSKTTSASCANQKM